MSTPEDPYAAPGGDQPAQQPAQQPPYGQPPQTPGYAPGYAPQPGYGPPPQGGVPGQPYGYPPATRTNGLAIAALVCSLAAFLVCISAPVGIVLGFVALSQIKRTGEQGRGLALAGIWIGAVFTALAVIGLAVLIAFGIWVADDVTDNCKRSDYATEQAYEDCVENRLNDRFNTEDDFTTTAYRLR